jgi:hypothetical protein
MLMTGADQARNKRERRCGTLAAPAELPAHFYFDRAKATMATCLGDLIDSGRAQCIRLGNGDVELRLSTGEAYVLAESSVTRTA